MTATGTSCTRASSSRCRRRGRGLGQVYLSPIDVILSRITVLRPDLVHVERAQLGILTERAIEGSPTLVVEVLSPSTDARDRGVKEALYARYGVPFYWIVDPEARTVQALRLSGESYAAAGRLDETTPAALPPPVDRAVWTAPEDETLGAATEIAPASFAAAASSFTLRPAALSRQRATISRCTGAPLVEKVHPAKIEFLNYCGITASDRRPTSIPTMNMGAR
jgi:hypothetical protein